MPRKNVLEVGGSPMLSHPVRSALESGQFDGVYVSTEDPEIAEIARYAGAAVIDRPEELARDRSTVVEVCLHALDAVESQGAPAELFCCIYATAIFLAPEQITAAAAMLDDKPPADVVMGVSDFNLHPVRALISRDGYLTRMWPEFAGLQSQRFPELVASNGTIYWARTGAFRRHRTFYVDRLRGYHIPRSRTIDIDSPEDVEFAHFMFERLKRS